MESNLFVNPGSLSGEVPVDGADNNARMCTLPTVKSDEMLAVHRQDGTTIVSGIVKPGFVGYG